MSNKNIQKNASSTFTPSSPSNNREKEKNADWFKILTNIMPAGVFRTDPDGKCIYTNDAWCEISGFTEAQACKDGWSDALHPGDKERILNEWNESVKGNRQFKSEYRFLRPDGKVFWVIGRAEPVKNGDGIVEGYVGTVTDITEQKQYEDTLGLHQEIINNMAEGGFLVRVSDATIVFSNPKFDQMFGYAPGELIGKHVSVVNAPTDIAPEDTAKEIVKSLKQDGVWGGEVLNIKKDSTPFWCYANVSTFKHSVYGDVWVSIHTDITEQKLVRDELAKSEQRYRTLTNVAPVGIFQADATGQYTFVNEIWCTIAGLASEEAYGTGWSKNLHPGDLERVFDEWNQSVKDDMPLNSEYRFKKPPDGQITWVLGQAQAIKGPDGQVEAYVGTITDITERKKLEEDRVKMQKLESLESLSSGIAHDFNNLLAVILSNISLVKFATDPEKAQYKRLLSTEKAAFQAQEITRQLMTFSRYTKPVIDRVQVTELLNEVAEFALMGSNVRCEVSAANSIPQVTVDRRQINQAITNIVLNADQAMPGGGTVYIMAEKIWIGEADKLPLPEGSYVKICIEDYGTGIPKDFITKIFDPYFTTKQDRSGLGLAISQSIINNNGGHIDVQSNTGKGTIFTLYLPAAKKTTAKSALTEDELIKGSGRVLVMDDEPILRELIGTILEELGYEYELTRQGEEAIDSYIRAKETGVPFDAVILDLTVRDGMGGKEAMGRLLEIDPHVKGIVSSGYPSDPAMTDHKRYGFCEVIAKPFKITTLSQILMSVIKKKA